MTPLERLARREFFGIKLGLDNVRALVEALGHPERTFLPVLIAGTNGKGSVAAMTARALSAAGHRTGLYTSPHLVHLHERYRVNDESVDVADLTDALAEVFKAEDGLIEAGRLPAPATYFELTTAAAFVLFRAAGVHVAVLEVGLGGRHDATNVVHAPFAAVTSIAFDHMAQLGHTLEAIAREKGGIIKAGAVVVTGVREDDSLAVLRGIAAAAGATLLEAHAGASVNAHVRPDGTWATLATPTSVYGPVRLALAGRHQADNALVAARLLEAIDEGGMRVPTAAITTGLTDTRWPGRLQLVRRPERPLLVVDGAHNAAGAAALAAFLEEAALTPATLVIGVMRDKDREALLPPLLACASRVVTTTVLPPRGLEADVLAAEIRAMAPHLPVTAAHSPEDALAMADASGSTVVVAGSLFLAGAVLALSSSSTESSEPADPA